MIRAKLLRFLGSEAVQVGLLLLLALLVRLAFHFRSPAFVGKDSQSYFLPGWELARGQGFELGLRRTPGYPAFVALSILLLGEELRALALAQHLLGVTTVGLTYLLGRLTFGRPAGLLAGLLVAVNGSLLIYERYVMSEALFTLAITLVVLAGTWAIRADSTAGAARRWLLTGLALGVAVLVRPVAQVLIPLLLLGALLPHWRRRPTALAGVAALLLGLALVQGPWVLRNALVTGNVGASTFGRTLVARTAYYDRDFVFDVPNQPHPDPLIQRAREIVQEEAKRRESDGTIAGRLRAELDLGPVEVNRVMRDVAVDAIRRDPVHYLQGNLDFALETFVGREERLRDHWDEYKDINPWDERIRGLVGGPTPFELPERPTANRLANIFQPARHSALLGTLLGLGSLLALLVPCYRPALLAASAVPLMLLATAALNGPVERYRYPLDPLIALLASGSVVGSISLLWGSLRRGPVGTRADERAPVTAR